MPNRLLKEGITDSEKINSLSADEEVFFYRLLVVADDFGLMDARPAILRARCFPLKESLSATKIAGWLDRLNSVGLLARYEVDGQPYLMIAKWDQRQRSTAKYPRPSADDLPSIDGQLSVKCQAVDRLGLGLGLGKGLGKGKGSGTTSAEEGIRPGDREWLGITAEKREVWRKAYPAIALDAELAKAFAWKLANPNNSKSNWERFLTGWFNRAQDRAPPQGARHAGNDRDAQRARVIAELTGQNRREIDITPPAVAVD